MKRPLVSRDARALYGLLREAVRSSALDARRREALLALGRSVASAIDGADPIKWKRLMDARRALAGAAAEGEGRSFELRRIAFVLERGAVAMVRCADVVAARLRARGTADEIACAVAPSLAARVVVPIVGALLSTIDARLSASPPTPALEPPFALAVRRLADGSVALSGAIADLLLETGALDTRADRTVLPSVARARLQGVIAKALSRSRKR